MVTTYTHTNVQGQLSVGFRDRVKTNGLKDEETNRNDCITYRINAVGNNHGKN